jgi:hypothetical protein
MEKMKTIQNIKFGIALNQDELEFWIPTEYTCKMISHLRFGVDVTVNIRLFPYEDNQIIRDYDAFYLLRNGDKDKRVKIKQSINGFCEKNGLQIPEWPENF